MHRRFTALAGVFLLAVATVLWVSATPQNEAQVKPAVVKSGSCCAHEGASKATAAQAKGEIKPVALKEGNAKCSCMKKAAAANGKKEGVSSPEMKATAKTAEVPNGGKACGSCPAMKSNGTTTQAKAGAKEVPVKAKSSAKKQKAKL